MTTTTATMTTATATTATATTATTTKTATINQSLALSPLHYKTFRTHGNERIAPANGNVINGDRIDTRMRPTINIHVSIQAVESFVPTPQESSGDLVVALMIEIKAPVIVTTTKGCTT